MLSIRFKLFGLLSKHRSHIVFLGTMIGALLSVQERVAATVVAYDASLDTLPDAQGWTFYQNDNGGPTPPAPTVSGGILYQGPTTVSGYQSWNTASTPLPDFTGTTAFSMTAQVKIINSDYYDDGNQWKPGYAIYMADPSEHTFVLGFSDTGVRLSTNGNAVLDANSGPLVPLDTTSSFNTYQLDVVSGEASLFVNGSFLTSLAVGGAGSYAYSNFVSFGDPTYTGGSQTELTYLSYNTDATVPEPASLSLLGMGAVALLARRRSARAGCDEIVWPQCA
jgi:hypothetical protein